MRTTRLALAFSLAAIACAAPPPPELPDAPPEPGDAAAHDAALPDAVDGAVDARIGTAQLALDGVSDFGARSLGTDTPHTFMVTNHGDGDSAAIALSIDLGPFVLSQDGC